jgi:hypothetical protein
MPMKSIALWRRPAGRERTSQQPAMPWAERGTPACRAEAQC